MSNWSRTCLIDAPWQVDFEICVCRGGGILSGKEHKCPRHFLDLWVGDGGEGHTIRVG